MIVILKNGKQHETTKVSFVDDEIHFYEVFVGDHEIKISEVSKIEG